MDRKTHRERICGNVIPLPTPFFRDGGLDADTLRKLVRRMLDAGYRTGNGVLLAGGAGGEFATLRTDERKQVAETVVEEAGGRIPVVVGAQDTSWPRVLELARFSESIGAEAIQVGAPYYDPATVDDIFNLFKSISDAVSVPLMIYNSWWTGQNADIGYEGVARAIEIANVGSLKWNSWAYWCYELVLRDFADRLAIVDNQVREVFSHEMGATAFVSHPPLAWPEYGLKLWDCLVERRFADAINWIRRFRTPYSALLFKTCAFTCTEGSMDKAALALTGLPVGEARHPARPLPPELIEQIRTMLLDAGVPGVKKQE